MPFRLLAVALIALLMLSGCTTKVAYNFLDWAIEWKIGKFVSLEGEQKDDMKRSIGEFHRWHRSTQLPLYAEYLTGLAERVKEKPLTGKAVHAETDRIQLLLDQSMEKVLPDVQRIASTLTERQVQEILEKVAEEREEYIDEHIEVSDKKRQKKRYKDFMKQADRWFGRLGSEQKAQVEKWSESLLPYEELNAQQQLIWQQQLKDLLAQREQPEKLEKGLRELMFYRTDNWLPELEKVLDRNQEITYEVVAKLINGLTPKQKRHFQEKLHDYAKTCRELAAEKG